LVTWSVKSGDDWVSKCRDLVVEGVRGVGRGKKKWFECVANDMRDLGLKRGDAMDRAVWKRWHFEEPSNPCMCGNTDVKTSMMMMMT
jgi:hypothetical protein